MSSWTFYPATTLPAALDVIWCKFPEVSGDVVPADLIPGPKSRPALVAKSAINEHDQPLVYVIYGTSNLKSETRRLDFFVENMRDMDEAGLYQATRFDLDKRIWLPWASEFFSSPDANYQNPAIGHLSQNSRDLLGILLDIRRRAGRG